MTRFLVRLRFSRLGRLLRREQVPVYQQMNAAECGAVCLRMVLGYWRHSVSAQQLREECGIDRSGTSAQTMLRVARAHGLRTTYLTQQEPSALASVPRPAILHWNMSHFVVLERCRRDEYTILDPAVGRLRVSANELSANFTGVVLLFEPSEAFEPRANLSAGMSRYLRTLADFRPLLTSAFVITLLLQAAALAMAKLSQVVLDDAVPTGDLSLLEVIGLLAASLAAAQTSVGFLRGRLLLYLRNKIDLDLNRSFVSHLLKLPFGFFEQRSTGDLLMRIGSNQVIRDLLSDRVLAVALDATLLLGTGSVLFFLAPRLAAVALLPALLRLAIVAVTQSRQREMVHQTIITQARLQSFAVEAFGSILSIKAAGGEPGVMKKWNNLFARQLSIGIRLTKFQLTVDTLMGALSMISPALILFVGCAEVIGHRMTIGQVIAFAAVAGAFMAPVWSLSSAWGSWQLASRHVERLVEVLDAEPEQVSSLPILKPLTGKIELRNVSFRYGAESPFVLENITVSIAPGDYVAIVGPSGCGKSTLAKLLLGLYRPTEGDILYDGRSLFEVDLPSLRGQIGNVVQDPRIFAGTIRENIARNSGTPIEQVIAAAQFAAIAADIEKLPLQYETVVAEGGANYSGGQRQRIAIARAVLPKPALLLFDEATSALDKLTEDEIYTNIASMSATRIIIAHRLSTVRRAGLILVLREGRIVQYGAHHELLAKPGIYRDLLGAQR
jgi:ABC-type bacteriocin/lantibiotic exporter with double-glycine peptidase domain